MVYDLYYLYVFGLQTLLHLMLVCLVFTVVCCRLLLFDLEHLSFELVFGYVWSFEAVVCLP